VELRPFGEINRTSIAIEAHDIAPADAGLYRLRGLPSETAAEMENTPRSAFHELSVPGSDKFRSDSR
jgi:hypothetical protein